MSPNRAAVPGRWLKEKCLTGDHESVIVVSSLQDHDVVAFDQIHEPVLLVDSARPGAGECMTELLGLSDPGERITSHLIE